MGNSQILNPDTQKNDTKNHSPRFLYKNCRGYDFVSLLPYDDSESKHRARMCQGFSNYFCKNILTLIKFNLSIQTRCFSRLPVPICSTK